MKHNAFVLINCTLGSEAKVMEHIQDLEYVHKAYRVYGVYDIIVRISSDNMETLKEIINWKVKKLDDVRSALSMVVTNDADIK